MISDAEVAGIGSFNRKWTGRSTDTAVVFKVFFRLPGVVYMQNALPFLK